MHGHYRGLCCMALGSAKGEIYHVGIGRFMFRVSIRRWLKPSTRRSYFYKADTIQFGPFTFYWRDKQTKEL